MHSRRADYKPRLSLASSARSKLYFSIGPPPCSSVAVPPADTMQAKRPPRVLGPYREGLRWRVITIRPEGRRSSIAHTEAEARNIVRLASLRLTVEFPAPRPLPIPPLSVALQEYERWLAGSQKRSPQTVQHTLRLLRAFLPEPKLPVDAMTPKAARALARFQHRDVRRIRRSYAVSTRHAVLGHVRRFYQWAMAQSYIQSNPFDGVRAAGITRTTERCLYPDEAHTWIGLALAEAEAGDVRALGALLVLALRLRSGQVLSLQIGDIDLAALSLRVPTRHGTLSWRSIPRELLPALRIALSGRAGSELLLGAGRTGHVRPRNYLWRAVHRLCAEAKVPSTCPRSLRGLGHSWQRGAERLSRRLTMAFARSRRLQTPVIALRRASPAPRVRSADLLGRSGDADGDTQSALFERATGMMSRLQAGLLARRRRSPE